MNKTLATTCAFIFSVSFAYADILHIQNGNNVPISVGYGTDAGTIPVNVINTVTTTGGGGGSSVNVSTYVYGTALGSTGTAVGGVTAAGTFQTFVVTASSNPIVAISASSNIVSTNGSTQAVTNVSGSNLNVNVNTALPAGTNAIGTVVQSTFGANASSINVTNAQNTSLTVTAGTGPFTVTQGTGTWQTNGTITSVVVITANGIPQPVTSSTGTYVVTAGTGNFNVIGTLTNNQNGAGGNRVGTLPGVYQNAMGNGGFAETSLRDAALTVFTSTTLLGVSLYPDNSISDYAASTVAFSIGGSTMDVAALCGNINKVVFVTSVRASCSETTSSSATITIAKRSTGYTAIWSSMTSTQMDSHYGVSFSTVIFNLTGSGSTNGTLAGYADSSVITCPQGTATLAGDHYVSPQAWYYKPIVLRSNTDCVGVNMQGTTSPNASTLYTVGFSWIETKAP